MLTKRLSNILVLLSLLLFLPLVAFTQSGKVKKDFFVLSYNVENLYDTIDDPQIDDAEFLPGSKSKWTSERYNKKINDLAKVISSIEPGQLPDLIGLYEIENRTVLTDLCNASSLLSGNYAIAHVNSPDKRGIDVALLYRKSSFQLIDQVAIPVKSATEPDFVTRDILYVRGTAGKGDTLHIFLNHWPSRREGTNESEIRRVTAATVLRNEVDKLLKLNKLAKVIILGDFNDEPANKSLNETLFATNNKSSKDHRELYNLLYDRKLNKEGSYSYRGEWNMLDNLIVSQGLLKAKKGLKVSTDAGNIFKAEFIMFKNPKTGDLTPNRTYGGSNYFGGYSDHLPVYFFLERK